MCACGVDDMCFESWQERGMFFFSVTFRLAQGHTQPPVKLVHGSFFGGNGAGHWRPSSAKVENKWSFTFTPFVCLLVCAGTALPFVPFTCISIAICPQMFPQVATVSYPTPRALNPAAFQTAPTVAAVPPVPPATPNPSPKQRVFTGTVTKVHDNFGFVDEDVFFQTRWGNWFVQEVLNLCEKYAYSLVCMINELLTAVQYEPYVLFKSLAMSGITLFPLSSVSFMS